MVGPIRFGLTPVFLDNGWQLLDRLSAHIHGTTGRDDEHTRRRTWKEVVALLLLGEIAAAWLCGYPLLQHPGWLEAVAIPVWRRRIAGCFRKLFSGAFALVHHGATCHLPLQLEQPVPAVSPLGKGGGDLRDMGVTRVILTHVTKAQATATRMRSKIG